MNKLWWAIVAQVIASIVAFFQLQGWVVWDKPWLKSMWWVYATSICIAALFYFGCRFYIHRKKERRKYYSMAKLYFSLESCICSQENCICLRKLVFVNRKILFFHRKISFCRRKIVFLSQCKQNIHPHKLLRNI